MALIEKDKTVNAIATYLFVNDAIKGPEPRKVVDYETFARSMLKDVPETDIVRCKECKYYIDYINMQFVNAPTLCGRLSTLDNYVVVNADDYCSYGERKESK